MLKNWYLELDLTKSNSSSKKHSLDQSDEIYKLEKFPK